MGSKDHSFDAVSEVNWQEVDNAVQQARKELAQRFDFKDSQSSIDFDKAAKTITLKTENEFRLKSVVDLLQTKLVKRNVSLKAMEFGPQETISGGSLKQVITVRSGIPTDKAREIVKNIKDLKMKVQAQIQENQVRVQAQKIDDLQTVIGFLRGRDFGVDLQFLNFR
jgi:cyclic-di-GMP-binding protein